MTQESETKICGGCGGVIPRLNYETGEVYSDERWGYITRCSADCFNGRTEANREYRKTRKNGKKLT